MDGFTPIEFKLDDLKTAVSEKGHKVAFEIEKSSQLGEVEVIRFYKNGMTFTVREYFFCQSPEFPVPGLFIYLPKKLIWDYSRDFTELEASMFKHELSEALIAFKLHSYFLSRQKEKAYENELLEKLLNKGQGVSYGR